MVLLDEFVDRPALAKLLNCSERTIPRYEQEPNGLPFQKVGYRKVYRIAAVKKWLEDREQHPNRRRRSA